MGKRSTYGTGWSFGAASRGKCQPRLPCLKFIRCQIRSPVVLSSETFELCISSSCNVPFRIPSFWAVPCLPRIFRGERANWHLAWDFGRIRKILSVQKFVPVDFALLGGAEFTRRQRITELSRDNYLIILARANLASTQRVAEGEPAICMMRLEYWKCQGECFGTEYHSPALVKNDWGK